MAVRKPLVLISGRKKELPAGDVLFLSPTSRLVKAMPLDADYVLTSEEAQNYFLSIVGGATLTITRKIIVPLNVSVYVVFNGSIGGQSLQFIGPTGAGVDVTNGSRAILECDGTNFNRITFDVSG